MDRMRSNARSETIFFHRVHVPLLQVLWRGHANVLFLPIKVSQYTARLIPTFWQLQDCSKHSQMARRQLAGILAA
ncbi:hypothetical protein CCGE525_26940 (plasmid) [Rhizobium jaguaris]|uniref:Uncharacterized protein n=1 Tax=Rhizobium jaguaris TaxID=1312183 RepID=A0A387FT35_9HYPH|nr:hypothetical protein CCGE525_26940 [Rhizobium jaguaris]